MIMGYTLTDKQQSYNNYYVLYIVYICTVEPIKDLWNKETSN